MMFTFLIYCLVFGILGFILNLLILSSIIEENLNPTPKWMRFVSIIFFRIPTIIWIVYLLYNL